MQPENQELEQEKLTQELLFKGYPSIELSTRDKFLKMIKEEGHDAENILWVASEKIHGSNFSIFCTGQFVRYGRRTDFLTKDIPIQCENPGNYFLESFYDARNLVSKFHNKLKNIYQDIKAVYPDMVRYVIYGEYFGGNWPEGQGKAKAVQKGIYYTPDHEFMAFDIKIFTPEKIFWVDVTDIPTLLKQNLMSIPIYARGTFNEIYEIETKIDSTIPQLLGLNKIEKNIIEGMVLRPNTSVNSQKYNERIILKKKNAQFAEVTSKPNKEKKKQVKEIDPEILAFIDPLEVYLNFNRIESVVSKFPDLKDRNKLKQEIVKDIMTDAAKDQYKGPQPEMEKKVKTQFDKRVMKLLNEYFIKH